MATASGSTKVVDESLWWDPFSTLLNDLENAPFLPSAIPPSLVDKLKKNHGWFLGSVSLFKSPNQASKSALDSSEITFGSHKLAVKPELKEVALEVSSCICLDEAQSYAITERSADENLCDADYKIKEFVHMVLLQYYLERQCLLKCVRQILMHACPAFRLYGYSENLRRKMPSRIRLIYVENESKDSDAIREEALQLIHDGLERKLVAILQDLISSNHPEHMEVNLAILWAEETLIEVNLVLDILFLLYYETFCPCKGEQWKKLCSIFKGILSNSLSIERLAISIEAMNSLYYAKVQMLLILIETLDLDNLLWMVHDEVAFGEGKCIFSLEDLLDMDAMISSFNALETSDAGPLILAWAVFLCLVSSLPEKQNCNSLMEIDHVAYVRQAFAASPLSYILDIFDSDVLKDSDSSIAGYRSVLRTFISAFIASYEITCQLEGDTFEQIVDILCKIYRGEESLCIQFWDKNSFVDGPIRSLLSSLEGVFPYRSGEIVRLLSALCEGSWPAECVYYFLDKMVGITSLFEISGDSYVDGSQIVVTHYPLYVPGIEGLVIPRGTRGQVLRVMDRNSVVVRWEYAQSGILVLLLHLARSYHSVSNEDQFVILDLLCRLVSFNSAICSMLMDNGDSLSMKVAQIDGHMGQNIRVDVVKIICSLVSSLEPIVSSAGVMSLCLSILTQLLKCAPSHVFEVASRTNIFGLGLNGLSSCPWLLSGGLARLLLYDCEQNGECCSLTISVLDFTMQLVEEGAEDDMVSALLVFSLQYVLVNHEHWKYKVKYVRWNVTLKVLEVMKKCVKLAQNSQKLGYLIRDILLGDSSVHSTLCRIMCITTETLERICISRLYDMREIERLQLAICSALDIVSAMLEDLSQDISSGLPAFHQAMLSSTTKPISVVAATVSLISFFRNPKIQVTAARVLSNLFIVADKIQTFAYGDLSIAFNDMQIRDLMTSIRQILSEETGENSGLLVAVVKLLTSAAQYQPALLISLMPTNENLEVSMRKNLDASFGSSQLKETRLSQSFLQYVERSEDLLDSCPNVLLHILEFLKALWSGAAQYIEILDMIKSSEKFWNHLFSPVLKMSAKEAAFLKYFNDQEMLQVSSKYRCQSVVLEIVAHELFLQKKLLHEKKPEKKSSESSVGKNGNVGTEKENSGSLHGLKDALSACCESSILENLVKLYASCRYDEETIRRAKMAVSMFIVCAIKRISLGSSGSLSLSLVEKVHKMYKKLTEQPAFSELKNQYSLRGYSEGNDLDVLILNDLYYHLRGEMEGREITSGPFKELSLYLLHSESFQTKKQKSSMEFCTVDDIIHLYDPMQLRMDLGLNFWDHPDWKGFKPAAERMLAHMNDVNLMSLLMDSKHSALKALTSVLSMYEGYFTETTTELCGEEVSEQVLESCINCLCRYLSSTAESLVSAPDASEDILKCLKTQAELLLNLVRFFCRRVSLRNDEQQLLRLCTHVMKNAGLGLRILSGMRQSTSHFNKTVMVFLMLLLTVVEFTYLKSYVEKSSADVSDAFAEVSLVGLGLLPALCNFITSAEYYSLAVAAADMLLKGFLNYNTWLPILQKHLQLQHILLKLQQDDYLVSIPIILKFLLTLARVRGSARMLQAMNLFAALKVMFDRALDDKAFSNNQEEQDKKEKPYNIWGLGLDIISAMIYSLEDDPSCIDIVDNAIPYFFSEKSHLISFFLSAPDVPTDDHSKKRARTQKAHTSLTALRGTEQTLFLICMLTKHQHSWSKTMGEMDSQLRERSIHLLAFVGKGAHRIGESPHRTAPLLCLPSSKEEVEYHGKPPSVNSKHGWFILSALGCGVKGSIISVPSTALSLQIKDHARGRDTSIHQTYFTDAVAIQMYRIAFLLLKFLILQAKAAAKRAEEIGFIDLAHFPELPMPEILQGLQDQAFSIVAELCQANKSETLPSHIQDFCLLLLQIMEMALYLEVCVSQTCGIRPVLGRSEDFLKEIKILIQVSEEHSFLKLSLKSLKEIIPSLYPGLLQSEGIL